MAVAWLGVAASSGLALFATSIVYLGSELSVRRPASLRRLKRSLTADDDDDDDEEDDEVVESLSRADAVLLPLIGGAVLTSLWLCIKYLSKDWLNLVLRVYFSAAGIGSLAQALRQLLDRATKRFDGQRQLLLRLRGWTPSATLVRFTTRKQRRQALRKYEETDSLTLCLAPQYFYTIPVATVLVGVYFFAGLRIPGRSTEKRVNPWPLSNLLAASFALNALQLLSLDSFATGFLVLGLLLVYDAFFVFRTPIMVGVARGLDDLPIKVVLPRDCGLTALRLFAQADTLYDGLRAAVGEVTDDAKCTMLGLGDIVIPGIFVALCRRFDTARHYDAILAPLRQKSRQVKATELPAFPPPRGTERRPYFTAAVAAYALGLAATIAALHGFNAAQPALIYLSPACSLAVVLAASLRGEWAPLLDYAEGGDADAKADSGPEKKEK